MNNLSGLIINRLTVSCQFEIRRSKTYWFCNCTCGNKLWVRADVLANNTAKSCGCFQKEYMREKMRNQRYRLTHGMASGLNKSKEYSVWSNMKRRCTDLQNKHYKRYGGRGITICADWLKFENFYRDMGAVPIGMSLDRIDNDGAYSLANCRWATARMQAGNTRNNKHIVFNGECHIQAEWARLFKIDPRILHQRLRRDNKSMAQIAIEFGYPYQSLTDIPI